MENFGKFITLVLAIIMAPIINGFVFCKLWLWFIVPVFDLPQLRIVQAIGISLLLHFCLFKKPGDQKDDFWKELYSTIFFVVFLSGFTLLSGWIVTLFL